MQKPRLVSLVFNCSFELGLDMIITIILVGNYGRFCVGGGGGGDSIGSQIGDMAYDLCRHLVN